MTIITTPLVYAGLMAVFVFYLSYYPTRDFDQKKWMADKGKRYEMSGYIVEQRMLIGKTKVEVKALLGDEGNQDEADTWEYYVGFVPAIFNLLPDVLEVDFEQGKVVDVKQRASRDF
ncbi:hypothetical protein WSM22_18090 [Cytophagales bacterium WSM2-2]|nr:hypothetical protein WSM22_18090 [Cytophagales bacterium WSM2-2]